jgi:hypothetical protein
MSDHSKVVFVDGAELEVLAPPAIVASNLKEAADAGELCKLLVDDDETAFVTPGAVAYVRGWAPPEPVLDRASW